MHQVQMSRTSVVARTALLLLALSAPVWANAPVGGDAQQYANFDSSSTTILDRKTLLRWDRTVSPSVNFATAKSTCTNGTRLPSLKELLTLVDETPHQVYEDADLEPRAIDPLAFDGTPGDVFWTSSVDANDASRVWTVYFKDGTTLQTVASGSARVRCVQVEPL